MATNWTDVRNSAIDAAKGVLQGTWNVAHKGAIVQVNALIALAEYIEKHKYEMTEDEYLNLVQHQKIAMQNVLTGYEAISIAAAKNAIAAVINTIVAAAPALLGIF